MLLSIICDPKIQSLTNKFVFRYRQSNVRRLLPSSDYIRALFRCLNCAQRFDYRALGSSRRLGGAAENLIGGREKRICQLAINFRVLILLEGAVTQCLLTLSEPHMNRKRLSIICSMLSRYHVITLSCCRHLL